MLNVDSPKIVFLNGDASKDENSITIMPATATEIVPVAPVQAKSAVVRATPLKNRGFINRTYTFDTFVVGPSNQLSYAAAHAVAEKPGRLYNPMFIYGGSGLGKTHLMHAIANEIRKKHKKAAILYQSTDRFVNEFINAIRFDKVHKFKAKYKDIDILLIDDVQFISNKEQTQEAFFHIFNSLHDAHKQIIFSSDTIPQNIQGLAERLRSRLSWGLVTDIYAPTLETKIAILKKKAELSNEVLADEVAHFIASRVVSNIRDLEGALIRVVAFGSLTKQPITLELAEKVLIRSSNTSDSPVGFEAIIKCVEKHYPYKLEELKSKNRNKDLSFTRQVVMFLMKKLTDKSFRDIGNFLGGRDHSTVIHAIKKVEMEAEKKLKLKERLQRMEQEIQG